jgi:hypothetical protein
MKYADPNFRARVFVVVSFLLWMKRKAGAGRPLEGLRMLHLHLLEPPISRREHRPVVMSKVADFLQKAATFEYVQNLLSDIVGAVFVVPGLDVVLDLLERGSEPQTEAAGFPDGSKRAPVAFLARLAVEHVPDSGAMPPVVLKRGHAFFENRRVLLHWISPQKAKSPSCILLYDSYFV